jgi:hypothetical protein
MKNNVLYSGIQPHKIVLTLLYTRPFSTYCSFGYTYSYPQYVIPPRAWVSRTSFWKYPTPCSCRGDSTPGL